MTKLRKWLTLGKGITGKTCKWENQGRTKPPNPKNSSKLEACCTEWQSTIAPRYLGCFTHSYFHLMLLSLPGRAMCQKALALITFGKRALKGVGSALAAESYLQCIVLPRLPFFYSRTSYPRPVSFPSSLSWSQARERASSCAWRWARH